MIIYLYTLIHQTGSILITANALDIICSEKIGKCKKGKVDVCDKKCKSAYSGGKGGCSKGKCYCYHVCPSPIPKICNSGIDLCSMKCGDDCCNKKCEDKYSGKNGHGICFDSIGYLRPCLCLFNC